MLADEQGTPSGADWLHEIKLDGHRIIVRTDGKGGLRLTSRGGHDKTWHFNSPVRGLATCGHAMVLDGEIAVPDDNGVTHIRALHRAMSEAQTAQLAFYAFDLLWLDGRDVRQQPIEQRKGLLEQHLEPFAGTRVIYVDHLIGDVGQRLLRGLQPLGGEGIISKLLGSPYVGDRSATWLKTKLR
jgi:bifunctional non-homologous end joining protein LigD